MSEEINIYCDESCHLENDGSNVMVLGCIQCPTEKRKAIFKEIREIKTKYGLSEKCEIKWTKVSESKIDFYLEIIDYFSNNQDLAFRALIVPDKTIVDNKAFSQDWDTFYYKMYYFLLNRVINPRNTYNIFIDIKDTNGAQKRLKLQEILNTIVNDISFSKQLTINNLQAVRSHEIELIQLADLLIGAVCYTNSTNLAKLKIIQKIQSETGYPLDKSTFPSENKLNLFRIELNGGCRCD